MTDCLLEFPMELNQALDLAYLSKCGEEDLSEFLVEVKSYNKVSAVCGELRPIPP